MKRVLLLSVFLFALTSCHTNKHVVSDVGADTVVVIRNVYQQKVDSVYLDRWHVITYAGDTIYMRDSIVFYKYMMVRDTINHYVYIKEPYVVEKEKIIEQKKYPLWWLDTLVFVSLIMFVVKKYRSTRNKRIKW